MYRLIASDLDETLICDHAYINPENFKAIKRARQHGVYFVPATGRGYMLVQELLKDLEVYDQENEYVMSSNGVCITENKGNRVLYFDSFPYDVTNKIFDLVKDMEVVINVFCEFELYYYDPLNMRDPKFASAIPRTALTEENFKDLKEKRLAKVLLANEDHDYLLKVEERLAPLKDVLNINYTAGHYMEITNKGTHKGVGLKRLADMLNIPIEEVIAIGDSPNDLTMLEAAGLGVCVGDGHPDLKDKVDYVTKRSCKDGAVAEVINKFIFNEEV